MNFKTTQSIKQNTT